MCESTKMWMYEKREDRKAWLAENPVAVFPAHKVLYNVVSCLENDVNGFANVDACIFSILCFSRYCRFCDCTFF